MQSWRKKWSIKRHYIINRHDPWFASYEKFKSINSGLILFIDQKDIVENISMLADDPQGCHYVAVPRATLFDVGPFVIIIDSKQSIARVH